MFCCINAIVVTAPLCVCSVHIEGDISEVTLDAAAIQHQAEQYDNTTVNLKTLRRHVLAHARHFANSPKSVLFFAAIHTLENLGYIEFKNVVPKLKPSVTQAREQLAGYLSQPTRAPSGTRAYIQYIANTLNQVSKIDKNVLLLDALEEKLGLATASGAFNKDLKLMCHTTDTKTVKWYHNTDKITTDVQTRVSIEDNSLTIHNVRPMDAGVYSCQALTPCGTMSDSITVSTKLAQGKLDHIYESTSLP